MINTNALQKNYTHLTTRERFALMVAALYRDDDRELEALKRSSVRKTWSVAEGIGMIEGFYLVAYSHAISQLANATLLLSLGYFQGRAEGAIEAQGKLKRGDYKGLEKIGARLKEMDQTIGISGYLFQEREAAWREFCAGLGIAEDVADNIGPLKLAREMSTLDMVAEIVGQVAYTEEEARAAVMAKEGTDDIFTRAKALELYRAIYQTGAGRWNE